MESGCGGKGKVCRVCRAREGEEWEKGKGGVELGRGKWSMGRRWRALKD